MHTAEHILNGTMVRIFKCSRSFTNHIEKKKSKCDYHFDKDLTEDEFRQVEDKVNETIRLHLDVTEEIMEREKAKMEFRLDKLPEESGEMVRIIRIGDYDSCPCIGKHVTNTSEIGIFRIISHNFENGVLRIRFRLD